MCLGFGFVVIAIGSCEILHVIIYIGVCVWGGVKLVARLQIGKLVVRSQLVSLEFFIDIILLIELWPWV